MYFFIIKVGLFLFFYSIIFFSLKCIFSHAFTAYFCCCLAPQWMLVHVASNGIIGEIPFFLTTYGAPVSKAKDTF